jgi:hypothetical protein
MSKEQANEPAPTQVCQGRVRCPQHMASLPQSAHHQHVCNAHQRIFAQPGQRHVCVARCTSAVTQPGPSSSNGVHGAACSPQLPLQRGVPAAATAASSMSILSAPCGSWFALQVTQKHFPRRNLLQHMSCLMLVPQTLVAVTMWLAGQC